MDWIEHLLGVSPDGGNGLLELLFYAAVLLPLGGWGWTRRRRSRRGRR
jgi:hypothetical protein